MGSEGEREEEREEEMEYSLPSSLSSFLQQQKDWWHNEVVQRREIGFKEEQSNLQHGQVTHILFAVVRICKLC